MSDYRDEWERQYQAAGKLSRALSLILLFIPAVISIILEGSRWYWDRWADGKVDVREKPER